MQMTLGWRHFNEFVIYARSFYLIFLMQVSCMSLLCAIQECNYL